MAQGRVGCKPLLVDLQCQSTPNPLQVDVRLIDEVECPFCPSDTKVKDSRPVESGVRRKRVCESCGHRFDTIERLAPSDLLVRKRSGEEQRFSRNKLAKGIGKATSSKEALPAAEVNVVVGRVMEDLSLREHSDAIPSLEIGRRVMDELAFLGKRAEIARIRYAMVFLGKVARAGGGFRQLDQFKRWLVENYGPLDSEPVQMEVVKRNGNREPFSIRDLERSVGVAAKGRGSDADVHDLAEEIARKAHRALRRQAIVTTQQIAGEVLELLREADAIAYLRYASAVKRYQSVEDFWREARALEGGMTERPASRHDRLTSKL